MTQANDPDQSTGQAAPAAPAGSPGTGAAPETASAVTSAAATDLAHQLRQAQSALDAERKGRIKFEAEVSKLKQAHQSDAEKAIEAARSEGRAEAIKAAGGRLAAAEFRARAAGRIADPTVLIESLDLTRFVGEDGEPNVKLIEQVVDKLATALANGKPAGPVSLPAGARTDPGETDWLRAAMTSGS